MILIVRERNDGEVDQWLMPFDVYVEWSRCHSLHKAEDGTKYWCDEKGQPYITSVTT